MKFRSEFQTGLFNGLQESVYRADPALSTSQLKTLKKSAYEFAMEVTGETERKDSESMKRGRDFHMYALERDRWDKEVATCPDEYADKRRRDSKKWWEKTKALGVNVIKEKDLEAILAMYKNMAELKLGFNGMTVGKVLEEAETEVSVFAKDMYKNVDLKCRIDCLLSEGEERTVIDIKTTRKGGSAPRAFIGTSKLFNYHHQEANYKRICKQAGYPITKWYWAVVETESPYTAAIYDYSNDNLIMANHELDELYEKLQGCMSTNSWPSHTPSGPVTLDLYGGAF